MKSDQNNAPTIDNAENALQSFTPEQIDDALEQLKAMLNRLITECDETSEEGVQEKERLIDLKKTFFTAILIRKTHLAADTFFQKTRQQTETKRA
jgi:hypothetical protein